jgi:hypothetical protein
MRSLIVALPLVITATPAMAQAVTGSATGTVALSGSVAGRCLFTTPQQTIALGELAQAGSGATAGKLDATRVNGQAANMVGWCNNVGSSMAVTATELTSTTSAPNTSFDNRIDYTAVAIANGTSASDSSVTAGAGPTSSVNVFAGSIGVTLSGASTPNNGVLVAGSYTGNVTVTLSPNVIL